jgi:DNA replication protein DnaC
MNLPVTTMAATSSLSVQLRQIGLRALPADLDEFLSRATKNRWSPHQVIEHLVRAETDERAQRSLERRLRLSGIKGFKSMADFDWAWPAKIERALTLDFLKQTRNLVLVGRNGLGKTMIAQNICHAAVLAGSSVLFRSAPALLEELHRQTPEGRRRKLRGYDNVGLMCIDEVGYSSFDDKAADLLYEVINRRYERKPVILTTNRSFKEWNEVFPNATCIVTMLDRLLNHADVTVIEGESYRVRESELEAAARRKKKCPPVLKSIRPPISLLSSCPISIFLTRPCRPARTIIDRLVDCSSAAFLCNLSSQRSCWHPCVV